MYGMSQFGEKLDMETGKTEEKCLGTDEFGEGSQNSWKTKQKLQFEEQN